MGPYEFNPDDAKRFGNEQGIKMQQRGNELHFEYCPYCRGGANHDKKTFSIDLETGRFKCLRESCGISGNMITLSRDFDFVLGTDVDEYYRPKKVYRRFKQNSKPMQPKDPAIKYLAGRCIPEDITARYEVTIKEGTDNVLVFPFYDDVGILRFIKYRKTDFDKAKDKNKEWCEKDCKPILFGMKQCVNFKRLVITEGQIDSLSVAAAGIENAVSVPTGAKGFTWVPYCFDWVCRFEEIVVFGDFENGRMSLLDEIKQRFPNRIRFVLEKDYQGCKDANEILCRYGKEAVRSAVEHAQLVPVKRVIPMAEVKSVDIYKLPKVKTGLTDLDRILCGGLPFGEVCVLAGKRGEGKSTLASQIMVNAVDQGYKVLSYSGEMPNDLYKSWFDFQAAGRNHIVENRDDYDIDRFITTRNQELINSWYLEKSYIYDNSIIEDDEQEDLLKTVETTIMQYGVKVVLIDNLMTALYIDDVVANDKYDRQGQFVRALTKLALRYNCLIVLVAHKRKNQNMGGDANDEVSGSMDITNLAGVVINYERGSKSEIEKGEISKDQRRLTVTKNRLFGNTDFDGIILDYDEKSKRIYGENDDLNREYGWNIEDGFMQLPDDILEDIPFS